MFAYLARKLKSDQMIGNGYRNEISSRCTNNDAPIDLSRRCDSVETRKTPSPYNSSSFEGSSPSLLNDSPTSSVKRETPSPFHNHHLQMHHRYMQNTNIDEINPFLLHFSLNQKLQNIPATATVASSPEILTNSQYPIPMMLGRDGKFTRPFKAYQRGPLSISGSIPISDSESLMDSTENYQLYYKQMMDQMCASNGGQPTIINPNMRRTSNKSFTDSNESNQHESDFHHKQQQQQQIDAYNQSNSDSSSNGNTNGPLKDNAYYERRRKNNAAAKKSRDRRRIKEDEIAIRCTFLERENLQLKIELNAAKNQLAKFLDK